MALRATRRIAEREGFRALTTSKVAAEMGCTSSTLSNVFSNLEHLITRLRGEMLDELHVALSSVSLEGNPQRALIDLSDNYIRYVRRHQRLWNVMFEHMQRDGHDWHHEKTMSLLQLVGTALAPFMPTADEDEQLHHAHVLWASLHGISSVQVAGKLARHESAERLARELITNYTAGLEQKQKTGILTTPP